MRITLHLKVEEVFSRHPPEMKEKILFLKNLVLETAEEMEDIQYLEKTLKWGEPSFITNWGSTL